MNNQQIASQIRADYHAGAYTYLGCDRVEFNLGPFTVRCKHSNEAVESLCAKFEKGLRLNGRTSALAGGRLNAARNNGSASIKHAFLAMWRDGEHDNAREYLRQFPRSKWPAEAVALLEPRP